MKITKSQLKQIIKEELDNIVNEDEGNPDALAGSLPRRPVTRRAWRLGGKNDIH